MKNAGYCLGERVERFIVGVEQKWLTVHFQNVDPRSLGDEEYKYLPEYLWAMLELESGRIVIPDTL